MENFVFNNEDAVVASAQQILAKRIQFKLEERKPLTLVPDEDEALEALKSYLALNMAHFEVEHLHALYLDAAGRLIKSVEIGIGTSTEVNVNMREVVRQALILNADMVVLAHNHPNQDPTPSDADKTAMRAVYEALSAFNIQLLMAFVVGGPTPDKVVPIPPPRPRDFDPIEALRRMMGL